MPDPFVLEKIRTGETDPYEVVAAKPDGTVTVTNFDEGTVRVLEVDDTVTTMDLDPAVERLFRASH